jgi:hypothetical protein
MTGKCFTLASNRGQACQESAGPCARCRNGDSVAGRIEATAESTSPFCLDFL